MKSADVTDAVPSGRTESNAMKEAIALFPERRQKGTYTVRIWPDRSFTLGRNSSYKKDDRPEYNPYEELPLAQSYPESFPSPQVPPLGLADATNSHRFSKREKRGSGGITSDNKRMVRSAGVLLERKFGRKNLMFGTVTLPALTESQFATIREGWADITRKFFQEVSRLLLRRGLSGAYVYVTEIQEKRWQKWGVIAPHLHWVSQGKRPGDKFWRISKEEIRDLWGRMLSNALGTPIGTDFATRVENPKKSLAAEMGKYLSKGGEMITEFKAKGLTKEMPSSWAGASHKLKKAVRAAVLKDSGEIAGLLEEGLDALEACGFIKFRRIYWNPPGSDKEIVVGVAGWFVSDNTLEEFLSTTQGSSVSVLAA